MDTVTGATPMSDSTDSQWGRVEHRVIPSPAPPTRLTAAAIGVGAIATAFAVNYGLATLATTLAGLICIGTFVACAKPQTVTAKVMLIPATVTTLFFAVWTSPWVISLDVIAVFLLIGFAATYARGGSIRRLELHQGMYRLGLVLTFVTGGIGYLFQVLRRDRDSSKESPGVWEWQWPSQQEADKPQAEEVVSEHKHWAEPGVVSAAPYQPAEGQRPVWIPNPNYEPVPSKRGEKGGVLRGLFIAAPIVLILWGLFAGGDVVFRNLFKVDLNLDRFFLNLFWAFCGAWVAAGMMALASCEVDDVADNPRRSFAGLETSVVLGCVAVLMLLFEVTALIVLGGGAKNVLEDQGLSFAQYARSGYFQLLTAATLVMIILTVVRLKLDLSEKRLSTLARNLSLVISAMLVLLVGLSFRRLWLYVDEYGYTMLRLYAMIFCLWLVLTVCALAVDVLQAGGESPKLVLGASIAALVALFLLNLVNPELLIVKGSKHDGLGYIDDYYPEHLSAEAVPEMVKQIKDGALSSGYEALLCQQFDHPLGLLSFNLSKVKARNAVKALACD